jgi:LAO/AO transport system kinase
LCQAARDTVRILDFAGKDVIFIETVGVGQDEIEVVSASDCVMLVTFPGGGDGIQAIKAGVMEIADLFVVNKSDRPGAFELSSEISAMLDLSTPEEGARPPVISTSCLTREGIDELVAQLDRFIREKKAGPLQREDQVRREIMDILEREVICRIRDKVTGNGHLDPGIDLIVSGRSDPYSVAEGMLHRFGFTEGTPEAGKGERQ